MLSDLSLVGFSLVGLSLVGLSLDYHSPQKFPFYFLVQVFWDSVNDITYQCKSDTSVNMINLIHLLFLQFSIIHSNIPAFSEIFRSSNLDKNNYLSKMSILKFYLESGNIEESKRTSLVSQIQLSKVYLNNIFF